MKRLIEKHQLKNDIGRGKLEFSPEVITYMELQIGYIPGMNTPTNYRKEGLEAQQYLKEKRLEEYEKFLNPETKEIRRIPIQQTSKEWIKGKKPEYITYPKGIGMSGRDPLLGTIFDFYSAGKVFDLLKGTGLYTAAKYFPRTKLGNYGRAYYISEELTPYIRYTPVLNYITESSKTLFSAPGEKLSILGPNKRLSEWTGYSGHKKYYTTLNIKTKFNKAKLGILSYIRGEEFKKRVINTGIFTEDEYVLLVKDLEKLVNNAKFVGKQAKLGAKNTLYINAVPGKSYYTYNGKSYITVSDEISDVLLRANLWHELMHSTGGHSDRIFEESPLVRRMINYNNNINPRKTSKAFKWAFNNPISLKEILSGIWLRDNVISKQFEVRARMATTLDRFRLLGYNTSELIYDPHKFIDWINEIASKRIYMPWDTLHLLRAYDISDLADYASKMLSTTGTFYLGNKILNNNENNDNIR